MKAQFTWENGERDRKLKLRRPCECGCDSRDGELGVGYLSGSDEKGNGFTIWIEDEDSFRRLQYVMIKQG